MNKFTCILASMLMLAMFAGIAASDQVVMEQKMITDSMPVAGEQAPNFTKLEISPQYGNFI